MGVSQKSLQHRLWASLCSYEFCRTWLVRGIPRDLIY